MIPQQCLHCRGSRSVGKGPSECLPAGALAKLLCFTIVGDTCSRLAETKWSPFYSDREITCITNHFASQAHSGHFQDAHELPDGNGEWAIPTCWIAVGFLLLDFVLAEFLRALGLKLVGRWAPNQPISTPKP